jgi:Ca2+-binding EF-hand superfamily protein
VCDHDLQPHHARFALDRARLRRAGDTFRLPQAGPRARHGSEASGQNHAAAGDQTPGEANRRSGAESRYPKETPPAQAAADAKTPDKAATQDGASEKPAPAGPAQAAAPPAGVERFILFTHRTPLVVEVELRIGGGSHSDALARLVEEVLKAADTDADGRPTWKELTESKRFIYGQFGNVAINDDNQKKQVLDMYDANKNGVVDRGEVPRFVTRNAGGARAFSIRGTADMREVGARETPLWQLLQSDDDPASLSRQELATAAGRLRSRDVDDDDVLLPGDLADTTPLMPGEMPSRNRRRGPAAVRPLGEHADWNMIAVNLDEQYALGARLTPASFPLLSQLFAQLDANHDGRIARQEYQNLNQVPAHVRLAVEFDPPKPPDAAAAPPGEAAPPATPVPKLKLVALCPELEAIKRGIYEQQGRLLVQLGDMSLMLYASDLVGGADYEARAKQLLDSLDTDKNGYLESQEVPEPAQAQLARFEAVDTDADGKVYSGEIVAFLAQQQAALRAQVHAKAGDRDDPLFAALDQNGDDRLDGREIAAAADRLSPLDRDGNGQIGVDEIPAAMFVGFARGSLENQDVLFAPPTIASRIPAAEAPRWFTSMDTSRDGLISQREFLGTPDQFASLDAYQDGFVDAAEAKRATPPRPPRRPAISKRRVEPEARGPRRRADGPCFPALTGMRAGTVNDSDLALFRPLFHPKALRLIPCRFRRFSLISKPAALPVPPCAKPYRPRP